MKNILILGVGQLGSRHLQGILKAKYHFEIYLLDASETSLETARTRSKEIQHSHAIHFTTDWSSIPKELDLVIIATNSGVREKVTVQLLENYKVKYLVLEKVLFPEFSSYARIDFLLKSKNTRCWVNHVRRMNPEYNALMGRLTDSGPRSYQVFGVNWGLGCNSLHYLDLFTWFDNSFPVNINTSLLDNNIIESKRSGYVEFTGTLHGKLHSGSFFTITSLPFQEKNEKSGPVSISILDDEDRVLIREGENGIIIHQRAANKFENEFFPLDLKFQSELSTQLIEDLMNQATCQLTEYSHARRNHEMLINALLDKYNIITNQQSLICPIT